MATYRNMRYGRRRRRPAYGRRTTRRRVATRRRYSRSSVSARSRTRIRIPGYIQPDYTLVKMKDRNVFNTVGGTVPEVAGQVSVIDFIIHGSDLFNAFALIPSAYKTKPSGFNQWMSFYNNFVVHKSGISITPLGVKLPQGRSQMSLPYLLTITPVSVSTLTSATVSFEEQPYAKSRTYNGLLPFNSVGSVTPPTPGNVGQQSLISVYNSIMTKKIMGVKDISDDDTYRGSRDESPNDMFYWQVTIESLIPWDGESNVANYTLPQFIIQARMYYRAQLLDRTPIPDSGPDPAGDDDDDDEEGDDE